MDEILQSRCQSGSFHQHGVLLYCQAETEAQTPHASVLVLLQLFVSVCSVSVQHVCECTEALSETHDEHQREQLCESLRLHRLCWGSSCL